MLRGLVEGTSLVEAASLAEGTSLAEAASLAGGTSLAEALHPHSSKVAQDMVGLIPVVGILFPSSDILTEYENMYVL